MRGAKLQRRSHEHKDSAPNLIRFDPGPAGEPCGQVSGVARMADIDTLFQLPLGEFTAARNALAASLKKAGRREEAERVKSLAKPSVPAWAVNQLYWRHRKTFDRLMASGADLRRAQASQLAGATAEVRGPLQERREALADLSRLAAAALEEADHQPTHETMRRITTTLEALAAYGGAEGAPSPGRLVSDVDPPGFEAFAALVPRTGAGNRTTGPTTVIPFRKKEPKPGAARARTKDSGPEAEKARQAERQAARAAVQAAERALKEARTAAARAEAALKTMAARVKKAEAAKTEAEERLERAAAELSAARQEARRIAAEAEEAAQAVADAERTVERAKQQADGFTP